MSQPVPTLREATVYLRALIHRRDKLRMAALGVGMIVGALLETVSLGAIPVFLSVLIDPTGASNVLPFDLAGWISGYSSIAVILWGSVALLGIFVAKNIFLGFLNYSAVIVLRDICIEVTNRLFKAYMRGAYGLHLARNSAHSIRNLTTEMGQFRIALNAVLIAAREGTVLVFLSMMLVLADPWVSIPTVVFLTAAAVGAFVTIRRQLSRSGQSLQNSRGEQMKIASQSIGALKVARVIGHEGLLEETFDIATRGQETVAAWVRVLTVLPRLVLEVVAVAAIALIVLLSFSLGREAAEILPLLILISISVVRLVPVLTQLTSATSQLTLGAAAIKKIALEIDEFEQSEKHSTGPAMRSNINPGVPTGKHLSVRDVSFTFPDAAGPTLSEVSMDIELGESVGLIGPSGAGKSTLVDLILGIIEPQAGAIYLEGVDLGRDPSLRQNLFGYVPQDVYLLDDTIRQNIGFGIRAEKMDDEKLWGALEKAHLASFVRGLPDGVDTLVGDRGARLSGGQRQRLGIARALYHEPSILVLDEATSALDNETEEAVVAAIRGLKGVVTLLTIAHRVSTLVDCDTIYHLDSGRIVARTGFDEIDKVRV